MRAFRTICPAALFLSMAGIAFCQAPAKEEFEVAAVKQFTPNGAFSLRTIGGPGTSDPGRITYEHLSFEDLLMSAYGVQRIQISGPSWLGAERYLIEATIRPGATKEQVNEMLRNLLADRFKLTLHRQTKEVPMHDLVVAKNGPKMKPAEEGPDVRPAITQVIMARTGTRRILSKSKNTADLAGLLTTPSFGPVNDKTGLTGKYDFTLEYAASDETIAGIRARGIDVQPIAASDLSTAMEEQLGLKLEAKKGPIEMLVVDHAEKTPTEN